METPHTRCLRLAAGIAVSAVNLRAAVRPIDGVLVEQDLGIRRPRRLATGDAISDVATRLFAEKGFDQVTVDEIAQAADVGRMTVFNHFPRKEDMIFDRDEGVREIVRHTIRQRRSRVSPIEALRLLAHGLVAEESPYIEFSEGSQISSAP